MSRSEDRIGKYGQRVVASILSSLGVLMVEPIGTPIKAIPHPRLRGYYRVIWEETVSGDHRGILPGGRSVLAETKTILDRNLQWSDLRPHQPIGLTQHADAGGLSLLVWVHSSGVYVMKWPVPGFGPGTSINQEKALSLSVNDFSKENALCQS